MARLMSALIISILILLLILTNLNSTFAGQLKLTNLQCEAVDPRFLTYQVCKLKLIRRGVVALYLDLELHTPVTRCVINAGFYQKANGYKPFLFNSTFEFCNYQKSKKIHLLGEIVMSSIAEFSNLNHSCPYERNIIVKDLILTEEIFRVVPVPSGDYMEKVAVFLNGELRTNIKVFFTRVE